MPSSDEFTWSLRVLAAGPGRATAYVRAHAFEVGVPLQFDEQYDGVTAPEYLLAALGADLVNGLRRAARTHRVALDQVEALVSGRLNNPLTYLDVVGEVGHPGLERAAVRVYVGTDADATRVRELWTEAVAKSPLVRTLEPTVQLDLSVEVVA